MMTKYAKTDNLLPPDAGIGIEALSTLFLRPNDVMRPNKESGGGNGKTVGKCLLRECANKQDPLVDRASYSI